MTQRVPLPTRKLVVFASVAVLSSLLFTTLLIAGADLYLHRRYEKSFGLNIHGYRGPTVPRKKPGDQRVAVLGGSTAFGYGVPCAQAFPAHLERKLREARAGEGRGAVRVVNLAYNGEGAYSLQFTLHDYAYLDGDVVLFYTGYNDLRGENTSVFRHRSLVFTLTGYYPILPLVLREKALALRYGGDLDAAYRGQAPIFRSGLVQRGTATALEAAVGLSDLLERQPSRPLAPSAAVASCAGQWAQYCQWVEEAVDYVLTRDKHALVVATPYVSDRHVEQHASLVAMLRKRFNAHRKLHYADLGRTVDLRDSALAYDGLHLTAAGNALIAGDLVGPILRILD